MDVYERRDPGDPETPPLSGDEMERLREHLSDIGVDGFEERKEAFQGTRAYIESVRQSVAENYRPGKKEALGAAVGVAAVIAFAAYSRSKRES